MEKPIIIQEDMIPAIPAKIKTTTRQVVKAADWNNAPTDTSPFRIDNLHWVWKSKDKTKSIGVVQPVQPGDILWVKEAWAAGRGVFRRMVQNRVQGRGYSVL